MRTVKRLTKIVTMPVNHHKNRMLVDHLLAGCSVTVTPSLCNVITAALSLHTPQSFPLKSLNCFSNLYVERPNHMATVSWNECPYLHCSPVMGASLLGWLERAGILFKEREDKSTALSHLCSWISRSFFFPMTVLSHWETSGQLIFNVLLLWLQTTTFPWDLQKTYNNT